MIFCTSCFGPLKEIKHNVVPGTRGRSAIHRFICLDCGLEQSLRNSPFDGELILKEIELEKNSRINQYHEQDSI